METFHNLSVFNSIASYLVAEKDVLCHIAKSFIAMSVGVIILLQELSNFSPLIGSDNISSAIYIAIVVHQLHIIPADMLYN